MPSNRQTSFTVFIKPLFEEAGAKAVGELIEVHGGVLKHVPKRRLVGDRLEPKDGTDIAHTCVFNATMPAGFDYEASELRVKILDINGTEYMSRPEPIKT